MFWANVWELVIPIAAVTVTLGALTFFGFNVAKWWKRFREALAQAELKYEEDRQEFEEMKRRVKENIEHGGRRTNGRIIP